MHSLKRTLLIVLPVVVGTAASAHDLQLGDVIVGRQDLSGLYNVYDNNGVFIESISTGQASFTAGGFYRTDLQRLWGTMFVTNNVVALDGLHPHPVLQTIPSGDTHPESLVFDASGNYYVGHADGNGDIRKFAEDGTFLQAFDVARELRGSDWVELAADQQTMFYTSEGSRIMRYDVVNDFQLTDFALLPGATNAYALRLLPPFDGSGGLIVADTADVKRLDGAGNVVQTYDAPGQNLWFAVNLDPNGTSLWSGDLVSGMFFRFNIASGAVEVGPINNGIDVAAIIVVGEIVGGVPIVPFCFGDGSTVDCPCANNGSPGNGCANSDHLGGAKLAGTGTPSLANDSLLLTVTSMHASSMAIFIQGDTEVAPMAFGDGLRCIAGLRRLFRVKNAHSETVSAPSLISLPPGPPATVSGQSAAKGDILSPGDVRGYQVYYRDPDRPFCPNPPGDNFNITNGVRVTWSL